MGYKDSKYKALQAGDKTDKYYPKPFYWTTTTKENNTTSAMNYLHDTSDQTCIGERDSKEKIEISDGEFTSYYEFFENVVPGDIIHYSGHIMMVQSIDDTTFVDKATGKKYWKDASCIHIIESVYNSGYTAGTEALFGVGNYRTVQMLNLLDKKWAIWRQK